MFNLRNILYNWLQSCCKQDAVFVSSKIVSKQFASEGRHNRFSAKHLLAGICWADGNLATQEDGSVSLTRFLTQNLPGFNPFFFFSLKTICKMPSVFKHYERNILRTKQWTPVCNALIHQSDFKNKNKKKKEKKKPTVLYILPAASVLLSFALCMAARNSFKV